MRILGILFVVLTLAGCDGMSFGEGLYNLGPQTIEHDGHSYVVYRSEKGVSMLHHPDCRGKHERSSQ